MEKKTFSIPNISCGHCLNSIKNELEEVQGVNRVEGSIEDRNITVEYDSPATQEQIRSTLKEINYPPAD